MSFNDCLSLIGLPYVTLQNDGDHIDMVFLCEPCPRRSEFRGQPRTEYVFVVWADGRLQQFCATARTLLRIRERWGDLARRRTRITRHGARGDTSTVYDIKPMEHPSGPDSEAKALQIILDTIDPEAVDAAYKRIASESSRNGSRVGTSVLSKPADDDGDKIPF
jgi:hypothetical protein